MGVMFLVAELFFLEGKLPGDGVLGFLQKEIFFGVRFLGRSSGLGVKFWL